MKTQIASVRTSVIPRSTSKASPLRNGGFHTVTITKNNGENLKFGEVKPLTFQPVKVDSDVPDNFKNVVRRRAARSHRYRNVEVGNGEETDSAVSLRELLGGTLLSFSPPDNIFVSQIRNG